MARSFAHDFKTALDDYRPAKGGGVVLRAILESARQELLSLQTDGVNQSFDDMFIAEADGDRLDKWGEVWELPRNEAESDEDYRIRLLAKKRARGYTKTLKVLRDTVDALGATFEPTLSVTPAPGGVLEKYLYAWRWRNGIWWGRDQTLNQGLVGLWRQEEDAWAGVAGEVKDRSGQENHGQAAGDANTDPDGKIRRCGTFDGTGDYVSVPSADSLNPPAGGGVAVAGWVKPDVIPFAAARGALCKGNTTNPQYWVLAANGTPYLQFQVRTGVGTAITPASGTALTAGVWHQFVARYDGSALDLFINGSLSATMAQSGDIITTTDPLYIGRSPAATPVDWDGLLDEMAVWNGAPTDEEIARHYNGGLGRVVSRYQAQHPCWVTKRDHWVVWIVLNRTPTADEAQQLADALWNVKAAQQVIRLVTESGGKYTLAREVYANG